MARRGVREARRLVDTKDEVDSMANDCDMVLSKEEFEMLQAFHRFVPLPALTSNILRVFCEDDLQVPEASNDEVDDNTRSSNGQPSHKTIDSTSASGNIHRHPCRPKKFTKKPHYQINLTSQTPRIQQQPSRPPSSSDSERSERPESKELQ
ncbi:hypothetical protein P3T76_011918 [Phytophthora citrophthora]|uniref:Uncharacterized protein n=1 Tax=Phytophthora citrophthora TaxID=4793 RepID=A0AAD9G8H1_9STRA|nr:hypothetical protein P3T76_011918 [Phytophthora citrophthora]